MSRCVGTLLCYTFISLGDLEALKGRSKTAFPKPAPPRPSLATRAKAKLCTIMSNRGLAVLPTTTAYRSSPKLSVQAVSVAPSELTAPRSPMPLQSLSLRSDAYSPEPLVSRSVRISSTRLQTQANGAGSRPLGPAILGNAAGGRTNPRGGHQASPETSRPRLGACRELWPMATPVGMTVYSDAVRAKR